MILLQLAEVLAMLAPSRVADICGQLGPFPSLESDELLRDRAGLKPLQIKKIVAAVPSATLVCRACNTQSHGREAARGEEIFCCPACGSAEIEVEGARPLPSRREKISPLSESAPDSPRTVTGRVRASTQPIIRPDGPTPGKLPWQTKPFRLAGPFDLRYVLGSYNLKHARAVTAVALSPSGRRLYSGSFDCTVKMWDAYTGQELRHLGTHAQRINCLDSANHVHLIATGSADGAVKLWEPKTGNELRVLTFAPPVNALVLFPNGQSIAVAADEPAVRIMSCGSGRERMAIRPLSARAVELAMSGDGRWLVVGLADGNAVVADMITGVHCRVPGPIAGGFGAIVGVAFLADTYFVVASTTVVSQFRLDPQRLAVTAIPREYMGHAEKITTIATSADGALLATGTATGALRLFKALAGGMPIREWPTSHRGKAHALALDTTILASGGADHVIRIRHVSTGNDVATPGDADGQITAIAVSRGLPSMGIGPRLAMVAEDGTITAVDLASGIPIRRYTGHAPAASTTTTPAHTSRASVAVADVALSADGRLALTATATGIAHLWPVDDPRRVPDVFAHPRGKGFTAAAMLSSPATVRRASRPAPTTAFGPCIVLGDVDGALLIYDTQSKDLLAHLPAHRQPVRQLSVDETGTAILSVSPDGTARRYRLGHGPQPLIAAGEYAHTEKLTCGCLSPDGRCAALGSRGVVKMISFDAHRDPIVFDAAGGWITAVGISADSRWVLAASESGRLFVWGSDGRADWHTLGSLNVDSATDYISAMRLAPDNSHLVAGTARGVVLVFALSLN